MTSGSLVMHDAEMAQETEEWAWRFGRSSFFLAKVGYNSEGKSQVTVWRRDDSNQPPLTSWDSNFNLKGCRKCEGCRAVRVTFKESSPRQPDDMHGAYYSQFADRDYDVDWCPGFVDKDNWKSVQERSAMRTDERGVSLEVKRFALADENYQFVIAMDEYDHQEHRDPAVKKPKRIQATRIDAKEDWWFRGGLEFDCFKCDGAAQMGGCEEQTQANSYDWAHRSCHVQHRVTDKSFCGKDGDWLREWAPNSESR